jgi:hypothetical protein
MREKGRRPRNYNMRHTLDWTQIPFEKEDPLVLFAFSTLVIGYMNKNDYD